MLDETIKSFPLLTLGIFSGILSGLLGVGSGALMVPVLVLILSFPQKTAQGTALAVMIPMALVGALRYKFNPEVNLDFKVIAVLAAGAVVGALIGTEFVPRVPAYLLRRIFAVFLFLVAAKMFFSPVQKPELSINDSTTIERNDDNGK